MAQRVVWSPQAIADVEAIAEFIEKDSPFYARAVVTKIVSSTRRLAFYPWSGRIVPEIQDHSLREIFVFSYRVIYQVGDVHLTIVAVIHGKRILHTELLE